MNLRLARQRRGLPLPRKRQDADPSRCTFWAVDVAFETALARHRAALLRHCYRMLGSFAEAEDLVQDALERAWKARASYRGDAPIERWLYSIATNACLSALARRKRRALPQTESEPAGGEYTLGETEPERWISPAPDQQLFPDPHEVAETRETVALAFVALAQRVPPKQRAALLLKDVLGWTTAEISDALGLSAASVSSALHRGRDAVARPPTRADEPSEETLRAFVRAWETRDLDALVALLAKDVILAMPPHAVWFRGVEPVVRFFQTPRFQSFWQSLGPLPITRANGLPAVAFQRALDGSTIAPHSIMVVRFVAGRVAEMTTFIGASNFQGFEF